MWLGDSNDTYIVMFRTQESTHVLRNEVFNFKDHLINIV